MKNQSADCESQTSRFNDMVMDNDRETLIVGDSTILGLQEKLLGNDYKVRGHSEAVVRHMYNHLKSNLEKNPANIILMVGTNDCRTKSSEEIMVELSGVKRFIELT